MRTLPTSNGMKYSYNWLQSYFEEELPKPDVLADGLIFHSFEVESIEVLDNDTVFDVKILPDRAHDCLSHFGIAREISAVFGLSKPKLNDCEKIDSSVKSEVVIKNNESKICRRYMSRAVRGVKVSESPDFIKKRLSAIGQRSINNIVDSANYVMFETGQPLHAFDLDKIEGKVSIRMAEKGETMETLDNKEVSLSENDLVIADDKGPIAIAGVKGGKRAGVTTETSNILLESANFDPVFVRKTSWSLDLRTDASKRFENDLPVYLAPLSMDVFSNLIKDFAGNEGTLFEDVSDIFFGDVSDRKINFSLSEIKGILGIDIKKEDIATILERLGFEINLDEDMFSAVVPAWRIDVSIKEDIAEEVGRIYGYENIKERLPEKINQNEQKNDFYFIAKLKSLLSSQGFSELMTYSFLDKGEIEVLKPLASDKNFLRKDIIGTLLEKINFNLKNNIFSDQPVKVFEIGNVFSKEGEETVLCVGVGFLEKKHNKDTEYLKNAMKEIFTSLGLIEEFEPIKKTIGETVSIFEYKIEPILNKLSSTPTIKEVEIINRSATYKKISGFPKIIRDIAFFLSPEIDIDSISSLIKDSAGELLVKGPILFDVFDKKDKDGNILKRSLAWRLVFQSHYRTLSDDEINTVIKELERVLENKGFELRK